jgi:hypothetical protein
LRWEFAYSSNITGEETIQIVPGDHIQEIEAANYPKINTIPELFRTFYWNEIREGFWNQKRGFPGTIVIVDHPHFRRTITSTI